MAEDQQNRPPPRVLHLVEFLELGGIERLLEQLARHTRPEKAQLAFFSYESPEPSGIGKAIQEMGLPLFCCKKKAGYDHALLQRIHQTVRDHNIEVVHTHDFGPTEYAVALKMRHPGLRLVHTQHTLHNFLKYRKYVLFFQFASWFYHRIVCVSQNVEAELRSRCRMAKRVFTTVYNGVDTDELGFGDQIPKPNSDRLRLVNISRLSPEKNLVVLLEACAELKQGGIPFELHHAGAGMPEYEDVIRTLIDALGLQDHVTLHGFVNDVRPILELGDVFVSPSTTEGHPVAVLEAMAAGKLCLLSDIPGHGFLGSDCALFFDGSGQSLADQLRTLFQSSRDHESLIRSARNLVLSRFTIQNMIDGYLRLYR